MKVYILTLFPEIVDSYFRVSIASRSLSKGIVSYQAINIRDFSLDKHKKCDDVPYGGGSGMLMTAEPIVRALESIAVIQGELRKTILLAPCGTGFKQSVAEDLAGYDSLVFICGRYEGVDYRVKKFIDCELSVGDFVLAGGETAALVVLDAVIRLIPGVLGNPNSLNEESFEGNLLEYPQYTRPRVFRGDKVPEVLLGGNHSDILNWRKKQQELITKKKRSDLL